MTEHRTPGVSGHDLPPTQKRKMTQAQTDYEVVKGWRDCAVTERETTMVAFYNRLLAALKRGANETA